MTMIYLNRHLVDQIDNVRLAVARDARAETPVSRGEAVRTLLRVALVTRAENIEVKRKGRIRRKVKKIIHDAGSAAASRWQSGGNSGRHQR
jgi:hypothetical protein